MTDYGRTKVTYPSYRNVGQRFGVDAATIAAYSSSHNCLYRRQELQTCVRAEAEAKIIAKRADVMRVSKDFQLQLVDQYLMEFKKALDDGRVRCDSVADLNHVIRLREYLLGGVDSRKEVQTTLSLEVLQSRHFDMMRVVDATTPAERGEDEDDNVANLTSVVDATTPAERGEDEDDNVANLTGVVDAKTPAERGEDEDDNVANLTSVVDATTPAERGEDEDDNVANLFEGREPEQNSLIFSSKESKGNFLSDESVEFRQASSAVDSRLADNGGADINSGWSSAPDHDGDAT